MNNNFEEAFMKFLQMTAELYKEIEARKSDNFFNDLPPHVKAEMIANTKKYFPNFDSKDIK